MSEHFPTTREFLIDHLLRIAQGVACFKEDDGRKSWHFGLGKDSLISQYAFRSKPPQEEEQDYPTLIFLSPGGLMLVDLGDLQAVRAWEMGVIRPL